MKKIFILMIGLAALVGCKTDRTDNPHIDLKAATAPVILPSQQNVVTLAENIGESEVTFMWKTSDYAYPAAVKYVVQIDRADQFFTTPAELIAVNGNSASIKVSKLNTVLVNTLKLEKDTVQKVKIRVASYISDKIDRVYSPEVLFFIRTYDPPTVIIPSINVPGSYQTPAAWTASDPNTQLWSPTFSSIYDGWLMMTTSDPIANPLMFKFNNSGVWKGCDIQPTVNPTTGEVAGTLSAGEGGNIATVPQGYYKVSVDWSKLQFSMIPITEWGVIGSATPGGWAATTPMTYNPATFQWEVVVTLSDGVMKFRAVDGDDANDAWAINFGAGAEDGQLSSGGKDIPVTSGKYKITMNLTQAGATYIMAVQ